jgi:cell division protein FtsB
MKLFTLFLALALIGLQWPLWAGKASVSANRKMEAELAEHKARNAELTLRNGALESEVKDLKSGLQSVEEYARSELGMVKAGEVFFQVVNETVTAPIPPAPKGTTAKK